ncbi:hypothetical protein HDZ31DRAFT_42557 [Schizophyllum fasciatum]
MGAYHAPAPSISPSPCADDPSGTFRPQIGSQAQATASLDRRRHNAAQMCGQCGKTFTRRRNCDDHRLRHENRRAFSCGAEGCEARFNTQSDLDSHARKMHGAGKSRERRAAAR